MESAVVLPSGKCRRRFSPEHDAFASGNALRVSKYYQSVGVEPDGGGECSSDERPVVFACRLFNCQGVGFHSMRAYEEHYDLVHRNVCRKCRQSFLSFRLLDIHLSETHDAFFRVMAKRQPMYVCLVDGCGHVFKHDDKRTKHLVNDHQYPASFSFHRPRASQHRRKPAVKANDTESKDVDAIKIAKAQARKEKRREKKKRDAVERKQNTSADRQEDEPMEISAPAAGAQQQAKECEDVSMRDPDEELAQRMKLLFIPKSVSFGRRKQQRSKLSTAAGLS